MTSSRPARSSKRPAISTELRVRRVVNLTTRENPLIPILLDMFESALHHGRSQENTELARIYNEFIAEKIPKEILQKTLDNYRSLSAPLKARITPQRFREINTSPTIPVNPSLNTNSPLKGTSVSALTGTLVSKNSFDLAYNSAAFKALRDRILTQLPTPSPPKEPTILKITPSEGKGYVSGQYITLQVTYPKAHSPSFKVILSLPDFFIDKLTLGEDYATINPKVLTQLQGDSFVARLQIKLPENFSGGSIRFSVLSSGASKPLESPRKPILEKAVFSVSPVLYDAPEITTVKPQGQLPGRRVIVEGRNIGDVKILDPGKLSNGEPVTTGKSGKFSPILKLIPSTNEQNEVLLPVTIIKPSPVDGIGQLEFFIPKTCIPGDYWLQLEIGIPVGIPLFDYEFPNGKESLAVDFKVLAHKYKVNFNTIHCIDESDPEKALFVNISDEIVTQWEIGADGKGWFKNTGEYDEFDDGETQSYSLKDSAVFMTDNSFGEVKATLVIVTDLYESNESDVQQAQGALNLTAEAGNAIAKVLLSAGVPTAAAIAEAAASVASALSTFIGIGGFGGFNNLGRQQLVWSAEQLQNLTDNPDRRFSGQLNFLNSDDDGSYRLSYTVSRLE